MKITLGSMIDSDYSVDGQGSVPTTATPADQIACQRQYGNSQTCLCTIPVTAKEDAAHKSGSWTKPVANKVDAGRQAGRLAGRQSVFI